MFETNRTTSTAIFELLYVLTPVLWIKFSSRPWYFVRLEHLKVTYTSKWTFWSCFWRWRNWRTTRANIIQLIWTKSALQCKVELNTSKEEYKELHCNSNAISEKNLELEDEEYLLEGKRQNFLIIPSTYSIPLHHCAHHSQHISSPQTPLTHKHRHMTRTLSLRYSRGN